jgi:hypothetical protein
MKLQGRLKQLEKLKFKATIDKDCICFPVDEPPLLDFRAERKAAKAVLCPLHGARFTEFAPYVWRPMGRPTHLEPQHWSWHSEQYIKAMKASFPSDRWPAEEVTDPDGTIRYVLKDGTELHRIELQPVHDDDTGLPIFENGKQLKAGPTGKLGFFEPSRDDTDTWRKAVSAFRSWNGSDSKPIDGSMGQSQPQYNDLPEEIIVEIEDC